MDRVLWVPMDMVKANNYNPNAVGKAGDAAPLYFHCEDGYTQPIVTIWSEEEQKYIIVDGFHRNLIARMYKDIAQRNSGRLPIVVIDKDINDRMASTVRHNRARGTHNIELMCHIVAELDRAGMSDEWIMKNIGMDRDEVLRLKQISGLADLFANKDFSIPDKKEEYMLDK